MATPAPGQPFKAPYLTGILAWLIPGAGHWYLGMRVRGAIIFFTIALTFWVGLAIGGFRSTIDPTRETHWFLGQICAGGHALFVLGINRTPLWDPNSTVGMSWGKSHDIGVVYAGVAGLLNLLAVFDAIVRSISGDVKEVPRKARPRPGSDGQ
ncbi:MAG: hypothetical protein BIFFINMI_00049 [Phycisphaerae bacterium]|nr:hypothetical protein [Phycisphaerae bacterium]